MRHRHYNGLKTLALFGGFILVLVIFGWILSQSTGDFTYLILFSAASLVMTAWGYWNSDKFALRAMKAAPVTPEQAPELHAMVADLAGRFGIPTPRLYLADHDAPNAFATGRSPKKAAVCCTTGILRLLDARELRGVLAHELSHVANRDVLTASVAAALANVVATAGQILSLGALYGRGRIGGLGGLVGALVAPLAATAMRLAISRTREYDADDDGARATGDPLALASALGKLDAAAQRTPLPPTRRLEPVGQLMTANPFGPLTTHLFSTHPPVAERIRRLVLIATELGQLPPGSLDDRPR